MRGWLWPRMRVRSLTLSSPGPAAPARAAASAPPPPSAAPTAVCTVRRTARSHRTTSRNDIKISLYVKGNVGAVYIGDRNRSERRLRLKPVKPPVSWPFTLPRLRHRSRRSRVMPQRCAVPSLRPHLRSTACRSHIEQKSSRTGAVVMLDARWCPCCALVILPVGSFWYSPPTTCWDAAAHQARWRSPSSLPA